MSNDVTINVKANTSQAQSAMSSLNKSFVGINSAIEIGQKAAQALGQAYDFLAGDTMKYAAQVRQMMRVSGQSAEMTSRMIQLTDDFALSEGSLEAAMRGASMKGIAFTVDNLAKLSDEYLKLAPGTERNTFLIQTFGRAGLEMAKVMERGSKAIQEQGAAQADNLIMTQANLDAAEELRIAEDNLNDSLQGLKYTLGNALIPELVKAANAYELLVSWNEKLKNILAQHGKEVLTTSTSYEQYRTEMTRAAQEAGYFVKVNQDGTVQVLQRVAANQVKTAEGFRILSQAEYAARDSASSDAGAHLALAGALDTTAQALDTTAQAMTNNTQQTYDMAGAVDSYQAAVTAAAEAEKSWAENLGGDMARALEDAGLKGEKLNEALGFTDEALGTNLLPTQQLKDEQQLLAKAYADGTLTADQYKQQLGEMQQEYAPLNEAIVANRVAVQEWRAELEKITGRVWTVVIEQSGAVVVPTKHSTNTEDDGRERAYGGLVWGGESYLVGERGPEFFTPTSTGNITPNHELSGGGITINTINVTLPGVTNGQQLITELGRMAANARNSGMAYQGV
jgi:hypothetical protein